MQVECIRAFGHHVPGDLAEVPDGAVVDPVHYLPVAALSPPPSPAELPSDTGSMAIPPIGFPPVTTAPKEM